MGDLDIQEDLCIAGESITMRDINSTLQRNFGIGILEECASQLGGGGDTSNKHSIENNASKDLHGVEVANSTKAFDIDHDLEVCEGLRRRKRKQKNVNINRVSPNLAQNNRTFLRQHSKDIGETQKDRVEEVDVEEGNGKLESAMGTLQGGGSPQVLRRCKRKLETSRVDEVDFDISFTTGAAHGLHNQLGLGLDISVSSTTGLGLQHASCNITHGKDIEGVVGARLAIGALNNKMEKGLTCTCDEAVGTTVAASAVSNKERRSVSTTKKSVGKNLGEYHSAALVQSPDGCRLIDKPIATMHNDYQNRGKVAAELEEVCAEDQTENQRLRVAVAALQNHLKFLYGLAEEGSKNCGYCQSIKEGIRELSFNCGDIYAGQVSVRKVATCAQNSLTEDAQECSSPVGSCTSEKTAVRNEACKRQISSVLLNQQMESRSPVRKDTLSQKDRESDVPLRGGFHEDLKEASEAECHLCIELASLQSEDPDGEQMRGGLKGGSLVREEYTSSKCLLATEREGKSDNLHTCIEGRQNYTPNLSMHGDVSSEVGKGADSFQCVEDDGECGDLSDKNSKEEDCWNSGITRNSYDSYDGGMDNQAEKDGFIDLNCGCTSQKYGDTVGILRLFKNGKLEIQCQCSLGCIKGKPMSPASFERHGGRGASKKWRETIWIVLGDRKVQFSKVKGLDAFVRRYKEFNRVVLRQPTPVKQSQHRDEFMQCKKCSKRRRFRRKTKDECRLFHEASMNLEWECSNYPFDSFRSCRDDEEREARQANRGCIRLRACEGCIECVCLGCFSCRFEDCSCRLCIEYIANNK